MATPPRDQIESILADLIKDSLITGEPVHVPGLGTFDVRHRTSERVRSESGDITLAPPRDEIVFTADQ